MESDEDSDTQSQTSETGRGNGRGRGRYRGRGGYGDRGRYRGRGGAQGNGRGDRSNLLKFKSGSVGNIAARSDFSSARDRTDSGPTDQADEIFDRILKDGGRVPFGRLRAMLRGEDVRKWVEKQGGRFVLFENNAGYMSEISVRSQTAKVCNFYNKQGCNRTNCTYLHICLSLLCGHCEYGEQCTKQHHFQDEHNRRVLRFMNLAQKHYTEDELKTLLRHSNLHVCNDYNIGKCDRNDGCIRIHVCTEYVMRKNCSNSSCTLDHDFTSAHSVRLLKSFGHTNQLSNEDVLRRNLLIPRNKRNEQGFPARSGRGGGRGGGARRGRGQAPRGQASRGQGRRPSHQSSHNSDDGETEDPYERESIPLPLPQAQRRGQRKSEEESGASALPDFTEVFVKPKVQMTSGYKDEQERRDTSHTQNWRERDRPRHASAAADGARTSHDEANDVYGMDRLDMREKPIPSLLNIPIPKPRLRSVDDAVIPANRPLKATPTAVTTKSTKFKYDPNKTDYICSHLSLSNCPNSRCLDQHASQKYLWLIQAFGDYHVLHGIESYYGTHGKKTVKFKLPEDVPVFGLTYVVLHFDSMEAISEAQPDVTFEVKRLSTRVVAPGAADGRTGRATLAVWCWQADDGSFTEYDPETSIKFESAFENGVRTLQYIRGQWQYTLDMVNMQQINTHTGKVRKVKRRP